MKKYCKVYFNGKLLFNKVKWCENISSRYQGLMFNFKEEGAVLVGKENSIKKSAIHMFFVFKSLDIFWLNKERKIVDIRRSVRPFALYVAPKKGARYVLELPVGVGKHLKVGSKVSFKDCR